MHAHKTTHNREVGSNIRMNDDAFSVGEHFPRRSTHGVVFRNPS